MKSWWSLLKVTCLFVWNLKVMMKDQFANYVVQKVLETCDDQQREMILTRIKAHLNTLKKYTYGKHIVARVEKLVAAGGTAHNTKRDKFCVTRIWWFVIYNTKLFLCVRRKAAWASTINCSLKNKRYLVVQLTVARFALASCFSI